MSRPLRGVLAGTAVLTLGLMLGGCSYDYAQRTDRVAYSAGNAVKANLEAQTIDPARSSANNISGLGRNGAIAPAPAADPAPAPTPAS